MESRKRPLIAVSSCLLGKPVRYNKNHCGDRWVINELSKFVDFLPVCPEIEMGLGVPREEIYLYYNNEGRREIGLKGRKSGKDLTSLALSTYKQMLNGVEVDGFILKSKSPSCGPISVKTVSKDGVGNVTFNPGLFAEKIIEKFPSVPKIDSGRIKNESLRAEFLKKVMAHFRFSQMDGSMHDLEKFHRNYKYLLMEHSLIGTKELGKLVANHERLPELDVMKNYYVKLFEVFNNTPTVNKQYNYLLHIFGYLKRNISSDQKKEILKVLLDFKAGETSINTAKKVLEVFILSLKESYLSSSFYFQPALVKIDHR